jgi:ATP-binding protein involved in chromosome partitioning
MNNQLADLEERVKARLDALNDPITGKGLFTSGRIAGLECHTDGKVSFTIEAPADVAELYAPTRNRAESEVRALPGVRNVIAVLTAHDAKPARTGKGVDKVKHIIAVASAKGGVGKSTIAVNLACAFRALGLKTGLLDLDVYGPSAPTLLGIANRKPRAREDKVLEPIEAHGLQTMSIGYLVDPNSPMIWRGAMATSAVRQMIDDVAWGDLDVLVLDLPPGTGDVLLTLVQRTPLAGAIIVSTPQEMALADVRRGLAMFEKTHAPILGIIENMAYFEAPDGTRTHIFGEGGARRIAQETGAPFLGEAPIVVALREASDAGAPLVAAQPDHPMTQLFKTIAQAALDNVTRLNKAAPRISVA